MKPENNQIILASASPRRAELLDQIGIHYQIHAADIDENPLDYETAENLVVRLAEEKSQAIKSDHFPVLGADTLGLINGELLVKPESFEHALEMLTQMSGSWHEILSAVALTYENNTRVKLNKNRVLFRSISPVEIRHYWESHEPVDKAGAYAIQGRGAMFVERLEGSYSGIMGLPLFETSQLLSEVGINPLIHAHEQINN